jgi:L-threonylcarbamoyladenylate synthase
MLKSACQYLLDHQIGIVEHDTVPGIVGIATVDNAKKIQTIKQRSEFKGFIVLIPSIDHLSNFAINVSKKAHQLIDTYWPGPLTIIFEKHPNISPVISGQKTTINPSYQPVQI